MNHLIYLNSKSGELEKILSGIKTMILKDIYPAKSILYPVNQGDGLYFMRDKGETTLRVKASVISAEYIENQIAEDFSRTIKEMQPQLQLTEEQFTFWIAKKQILLVEFCNAHKIEGIQLASQDFDDRNDWIDFEDFRING